MQELSLKSGGGRNFGRGCNLGRVRYVFFPIMSPFYYTPSRFLVLTCTYNAILFQKGTSGLSKCTYMYMYSCIICRHSKIRLIQTHLVSFRLHLLLPFRGKVTICTSEAIEHGNQLTAVLVLGVEGVVIADSLNELQYWEVLEERHVTLIL